MDAGQCVDFRLGGGMDSINEKSVSPSFMHSLIFIESLLVSHSAMHPFIHSVIHSFIIFIEQIIIWFMYAYVIIYICMYISETVYCRSLSSQNPLSNPQRVKSRRRVAHAKSTWERLSNWILMSLDPLATCPKDMEQPVARLGDWLFLSFLYVLVSPCQFGTFPTINWSSNVSGFHVFPGRLLWWPSKMLTKSLVSRGFFDQSSLANCELWWHQVMLLENVSCEYW